MSERYYIIDSVERTTTSKKSIKFNKFKLFTGEPRYAAMKAMTHVCKQPSNSRGRGACVYVITVAEVRPVMINGKKGLRPVLTSEGAAKKYKYKLRQMVYGKNEQEQIKFPSDNVKFRTHVKITESYGKV
jgi:hypothetical protein